MKLDLPYVYFASTVSGNPPYYHWGRVTCLISSQDVITATSNQPLNWNLLYLCLVDHPTYEIGSKQTLNENTSKNFCKYSLKNCEMQEYIHFCLKTETEINYLATLIVSSFFFLRGIWLILCLDIA